MFLTTVNVAHAQTFPAPLTPYVSDFADLIDPETEARITADLRKLRQERGTELAVVTIESRAKYGDAGTLESFATALFNDWGIGNATRNDGILFLVSRDDRETRIELGAGYSPVYDDRMKTVIDHTIIPYFREGNFSAGIEAGVLEIGKRTDFAFTDAPPVRKSWLRANMGLLVFGLMAVVIGFLSLRRRLWDMAQKLRRCPSCGQKTLSTRRNTIRPADRTTSGLEERLVWCTNCDYRNTTTRVLPRIRSHRSGGSFGGGRSGGGGASGKW